MTLLFCPFKAHLNGSVWSNPQGIWTATVDAELDGQRGFLRLNARPWPELSVEGELSHNLPALKDLPEHSRLRVTCRVGKQRYDTEAVIQMEECTVGASGVVMSQPGLRGSLVYHNNCTVIQVNILRDYLKAYWISNRFTASVAINICRSGVVRTGCSPLCCWLSPQLLQNLRSP